MSFIVNHLEVTHRDRELLGAFNNMDAFFRASLVECAVDMCLFSGSLIKLDEGFDQIPM